MSAGPWRSTCRHVRRIGACIGGRGSRRRRGRSGRRRGARRRICTSSRAGDRRGRRRVLLRPGAVRHLAERPGERGRRLLASGRRDARRTADAARAPLGVGPRGRRHHGDRRRRAARVRARPQLLVGRRQRRRAGRRCAAPAPIRARWPDESHRVAGALHRPGRRHRPVGRSCPRRRGDVGGVRHSVRGCAAEVVGRRRARGARRRAVAALPARASSHGAITARGVGRPCGRCRDHTARIPQLAPAVGRGRPVPDPPRADADERATRDPRCCRRRLPRRRTGEPRDGARVRAVPTRPGVRPVRRHGPAGLPRRGPHRVDGGRRPDAAGSRDDAPFGPTPTASSSTGAGRSTQGSRTSPDSSPQQPGATRRRCASSPSSRGSPVRIGRTMRA